MKKCILIVDVQVGFINEATKHIPALVRDLQKDYEYVYITRFFNAVNSPYRTLLNWHRFGKESDDFKLAFTPKNTAIILDKCIYSCVNEDFLKDIRNNEITEVDICGIDTDICVTKCAVDLFESGIKPRVLSKYCASHAGLMSHTFALKTLIRFIGNDQVIV